MKQIMGLGMVPFTSGVFSWDQVALLPQSSSVCPLEWEGLSEKPQLWRNLNQPGPQRAAAPGSQHLGIQRSLPHRGKTGATTGLISLAFMSLQQVHTA